MIVRYFQGYLLPVFHNVAYIVSLRMSTVRRIIMSFKNIITRRVLRARLRNTYTVSDNRCLCIEKKKNVYNRVLDSFCFRTRIQPHPRNNGRAFVRRSVVTRRVCGKNDTK